jgi:hypothetical protein
MTAHSGLNLAIIEQLAGGKIGVRDVPCPFCGPARHKPGSQRKPVLRVWYVNPAFVSFNCARCGEHGFIRDGAAIQVDPAAVARAKAQAAQHERVARADRLSKARWLWTRAHPIAGTVAERYLREARGYTGPLPATLRFLPARGAHGPAMVAAFGIASEPEPGRITIASDAVVGIHVTRLSADGGNKAGTDADKIMIGMSAGWPIVLAPPNDLLGLAVAEGIEDALSAHIATGLGAWAAGSASRLPALADVIPAYIESVTILSDADPDGRRHAAELARRLRLQQIGRAIRVVHFAPISERAAA